MDASTLSFADIYMPVISGLPRKERLDLIDRIKLSLATPKKKTREEDPFACFSGDFGGDISTEELIEDLRSARTNNWDVEPW